MTRSLAVSYIALMFVGVALGGAFGWLWFAILPWWLALPATVISSLGLGIGWGELVFRLDRRRRGGDDR